jgi:hypothetical protein
MIIGLSDAVKRGLWGRACEPSLRSLRSILQTLGPGDPDALRMHSRDTILPIFFCMQNIIKIRDEKVSL